LTSDYHQPDGVVLCLNQIKSHDSKRKANITRHLSYIVQQLLKHRTRRLHPLLDHRPQLTSALFKRSSIIVIIGNYA
jgi:hypothetical protein